MFHSLREFFGRYDVILRYGISGVIGILVNLITLYLLTDLAGLWYLLSAVLAYIMSFIVAFTLQKYWTFRDTDHSRLPRQATLYLMIALGALLFDLLALYILVDIFEFWYLGSQIFVLAIIAGTSFLLNKNITFK
jgi:dolichol-phosphate mannosyltransferase